MSFSVKSMTGANFGFHRQCSKSIFSSSIFPKCFGGRRKGSRGFFSTADHFSEAGLQNINVHVFQFAMAGVSFPLFAIASRLPKVFPVGRFVTRSGVVHRIDECFQKKQIDSEFVFPVRSQAADVERQQAGGEVARTYPMAESENDCCRRFDQDAFSF